MGIISYVSLHTGNLDPLVHPKQMNNMLHVKDL